MCVRVFFEMQETLISSPPFLFFLPANRGFCFRPIICFQSPFPFLPIPPFSLHALIFHTFRLPETVHSHITSTQLKSVHFHTNSFIRLEFPRYETSQKESDAFVSAWFYSIENENRVK